MIFLYNLAPCTSLLVNWKVGYNRTLTFYQTHIADVLNWIF